MEMERQGDHDRERDVEKTIQREEADADAKEAAPSESCRLSGAFLWNVEWTVCLQRVHVHEVPSFRQSFRLSRSKSSSSTPQSTARSYTPAEPMTRGRTSSIPRHSNRRTRSSTDV